MQDTTCRTAGTPEPEFSDLAKIFGVFLKKRSGTGSKIIESIGADLVAARQNGDSFILLDDEKIAALRSAPHLLEGSEALLALDGNKLYLFREYRNEITLARGIAERLTAEAPEMDFSDEEILAAFLRKDDPDFKPNAEQIAAVKNSLSQNFSIITGGPGTGKTTIIDALIALELKRNPKLLIEVAAPTGKAAELLTKGVNRADRNYSIKAKTLHSLFKARPETGKFGKNSADPLECDLLIVDECSMISLDVAAKMFNGLKPGTRVVLSGDHRQLEAIGSGAVLSSLLTFTHDRTAGAEKLKSAGVELTINYRSKLAPAIQGLAKDMRNRLQDEELCKKICSTQSENYTFKTISKNTHDEIMALAAAAWKELPAIASSMTPESAARAFKLLKSFRIITAMRIGSGGCNQLNQDILKILKMPGRYTPGSALLITQNCRRTGLSNGDVGIVFADKEQSGVKVCFENLATPLAVHELPEHESAFAMTVHKAQGSGFQKVCFPMPAKDTPLLTRELFYTALTRAAEHITVFGNSDSVMSALTQESRRVTALAERIIDILNNHEKQNL